MEQLDSIQRTYVRRLEDYDTPIRAVLDNPAEIIPKLVFQEVVGSQEALEKTSLIQSSPLWRQQVDVFFSEILLKTNYKDLRRVEKAFLSFCKTKKQEVDKNQREADEIKAIFGIIAQELKKQDSKIKFNEPKDDGIQSDSSQATGSGGTGAAANREPTEEEKLKQDRYKFHNDIIQKGDPDKLKEFLEDAASNNSSVWMMETGDTPLHLAARSKNTKWAKEFIDIIMSPDDGQWNCPWGRGKGNLRELVNLKNAQGKTALHLALENQSTQVVQCLIEKGADFLIKDSKGKAPLETMYEDMPQAVIRVLTETAIPRGKGEPDDGNLELELDFGALVGLGSPAVSNKNKPQTITSNANEEMEMRERQPENNRSNNEYHEVPMSQEEETYLEMDLLTKMVYQNFDSSASVILPHVVVKTFLELKWNKLKWPVYILTFFYIIVYLLFTLFAIHIFISRFPYDTKSGNSNDKNTTGTPGSPGSLTFWDYVFGIWLQPAAGIEPGDPRPGAKSLIDPGLAAPLMVLIVLCFLMECYEFKLIKEIASWRQAVLYYFYDLENILQIPFTVAACVITSVGFWSESRLDNWTYWVAAFSVVVAWMLILLQLGNLFGLGKYVQMLKTVLRRFGEVMLTFVWILVGFSVAFSILFPGGGFDTFPTSFFRSVSMMAGEPNYPDTFKPDEIRPFPFATHVIHLGFTVIVTIVLINLLTAVAVDDVGKIFKESNVIQRSIEVKRLYILERIVQKWRCLRTCVDLCVMPMTEGSPRTLTQKITDLPPQLHPELRLFYANPQEYEKQYLQQE